MLSLIRALLALLVLPTLTNTQSATSSTTANLPQCGQTCVVNSLNQYAEFGCTSAQNTTCLCDAQNFSNGIRDCSEQACASQSDAALVLAYLSDLCNGTDILSSGSSAATAAASTSGRATSTTGLSTGGTAASGSGSGSSVETVYVTTTPNSNANSSLSTAAKAGIGVGASVGALLFIGGLVFVVRRIMHLKDISTVGGDAAPTMQTKPELDSVEKTELMTAANAHEIGGRERERIYELPARRNLEDDRV